MNVTVYSRPACSQCTATYRALNKKNLDHTVVDVSQDEEAYQFALSLGYMQAPVLVVRNAEGEVVKHWSGFNPDNIEELALSQAAVAA